MREKIKILFVSPYIVNDSIFQAGHRSFGYYLSNFCKDKAFDIGYLVEHNNDEAFNRMKSKYYNAKDFSIRTPKYVRKFEYIYYNSILQYLFSLINSAWICFNPVRSFFYKKALLKINDLGWIPDVIVFEWTEVIFLRNFCHKLFSTSLLLATEHDISFKKLFRQFDKNLFLKTFLLQRFKNKELNVLKTLDMISVLSTDDLLLLKENHILEQKILLISPYYNRTNQKQIDIKPNIIFFGAMKRVENLEAVKWFLNNVFIPYQLNNLVELVVVGSEIPDAFVRKFNAVKNLTFTGFVQRPEDYFASALCMVVPLTYGGGIKIKVLEAMSSSVTVLSNDIGIEGIKAVADVSYIHCTEPSDYYNAVLKLYKDKGLARSIGEAGRLMMESNYNYNKSYQEYRNRIVNLHKCNRRLIQSAQVKIVHDFGHN